MKQIFIAPAAYISHKLPIAPPRTHFLAKNTTTEELSTTFGKIFSLSKITSQMAQHQAFARGTKKAAKNSCLFC